MKCKCDNPNWCTEGKRVITLGKNLGKTEYTIRCYNCWASWKTFKAPDIDKLDKLMGENKGV